MRGCLCEAISQHTHTTGSQHSILASCTKVEKQTHAQGVKAYTRCYSITLQISGPEVSTDRCPTFKHHFRWFTILVLNPRAPRAQDLLCSRPEGALLLQVLLLAVQGFLLLGIRQPSK